MSEPNILWAIADDNRDYREPVRKSTTAAAFDFFLPTDLRVRPGEREDVPLNLLCFMPENYQATLRVRSGIGRKYITRNAIGPRNRPMVWRALSNLSSAGDRTSRCSSSVL